MAGPFEVDYAVLCDYTAPEASGKHIFAGVYGGELVFSAGPDVWPPFWLVVALRPIARKFEFAIHFMRPDDRALIAFTGSYEAVEDPLSSARLMVPIQFPPIRFTGPGRYRIEVSEKEGQRIFKKLIDVRVGPGPSQQPPKLSGDATFDAEL